MRKKVITPTKLKRIFGGKSESAFHPFPFNRNVGAQVIKDFKKYLHIR